MKITIAQKSGTAVMDISGRLDAITAIDAENSLTELVKDGNYKILLNLSGLDYISSAGIRVLLTVAKLLKRHDGQLTFTGLKGGVLNVFNMSGLQAIFKVYETEEEALAKR